MNSALKYGAIMEEKIVEFYNFSNKTEKNQNND